MLSPESYPTDRREAVRYPIALILEYRLAEAGAGCVGHGRTLNISNSGLLFEADSPLPLGARIEMTIFFPLRLTEHASLRVRIAGCVQRVEGQQTAVRLEKRNFDIQFQR